MKLNQGSRPFTLPVSAALATLLIAPALWPKLEKRFMNWAVPEDAALQARADSTARQAQNPAATSIVHGAISGMLAASSSAREELPYGTAWPLITSFDREFAHLGNTLRNALGGWPFATPNAGGFGVAGAAKDGLSEHTLLDPEFGAGFLAMDSPLVRKWGLAFHGSQSGGVDLSDEALRAYAANLLATLVTSAEGSATWTSSDSLVSVSVNTGPVDGGSILGSGYSLAFSAAISTLPGVQPALVVAVNAPQPLGSYGFVAAPPPVSGSNAAWNGRSAGGSLPAKLRPNLSTTAPSPLAATRSSVADRGVVSGRSNPFAALLNTTTPKVPSSFLPAPIPTGIRLQSAVASSGTSTASVTALTPVSVSTVHAQAPSGLTINPTYDSTITSDPNAATIEASIQTAINNLQSYITSPVTVSINFQEVSSGLGESYASPYNLTYSSYRSSLATHQTLSANDNAALASLPVQTANPVNSSTGNNMQVAAPVLRALGYNTPGFLNASLTNQQFNGTFDGVIGLNMSIINESRTGTQNPSNYDLQAVVTHEMDEVLGTGGAGSTLREGGSTTGPVGPLDLYRYSSNGVRSYSTNPGADPYFSINGGATNLVYFNQEGAADGADMADWGNGTPGAEYGNNPAQVQDAYGTQGAQPNLGKNEMIALDVVGWNMTTAGLALEGIPEPDSTALLAGAAITLLVVHRRRKSAAA